MFKVLIFRLTSLSINVTSETTQALGCERTISYDEKPKASSKPTKTSVVTNNA